MQIDNFSELLPEKRPTENLIMEGSPEELENWINRVVRGNEKKNLEFMVNDNEID